MPQRIADRDPTRSARRRAPTRQADGSFVLNGEKMWITNGGFADVFIVFAKVDGEHFTAFIVERAFPGVSSGKEEHKMGLHGSSTTPVILQDVRVPAENLLGEVGKGHKVAFNVLNFGRFKLGAMCSGGAQGAIGEAARYAAQRKQFGQPIATFGAIKHKLGEMIVRAYALESLLYRTAGLIDARIDATPHESTDGSAALAALEEFAIEASIAKVAGSEMLDFVLDENVQIHGGNGFVQRLPGRAPLSRRARQPHLRGHQRDQPAADSRHAGAARRQGRPADHRGGQGTSGRVDRVLRRCSDADDSPLGDERRAVRRLQEGGADGVRHGDADIRREARDQQEVLMHLADMLIDVFAAESAVLRAAAASGESAGSLHADAARVFVNDAAMRVGRVGPPGARRDGRGRHAAHAARRAATADQGHADQHRRAAPPPRG